MDETVPPVTSKEVRDRALAEVANFANPADRARKFTEVARLYPPSERGAVLAQALAEIESVSNDAEGKIQRYTELHHEVSAWEQEVKQTPA